MYSYPHQQECQFLLVVEYILSFAHHRRQIQDTPYSPSDTATSSRNIYTMPQTNAGQPMQRHFNPYSENGGTILAIAASNFSVIARDTRQTEGYEIQTCYAPKPVESTSRRSVRPWLQGTRGSTSVTIPKHGAARDAGGCVMTGVDRPGAVWTAPLSLGRPAVSQLHACICFLSFYWLAYSFVRSRPSLGAPQGCMRPIEGPAILSLK